MMQPKQDPDPNIRELLARAADTLNPTSPPLDTLRTVGRRRRQRRAAFLAGASLAVVGGVTATAIAVVPPASQRAVPEGNPNSTGAVSTPTASQTRAVTPAPCTLQQLSFSWSPESSGLAMQHGTIYFLVIENRSHVTCTVSGTPMLKVDKPKAHVVVKPGYPPMAPPRGGNNVALDRGQRAVAILWNPSSAACQNGVSPQTWRISLGQTAGSRLTQVPVAAHMGICTGSASPLVSRMFSAKKNPDLSPSR